MALSLTSPSFSHGDAIPAVHTCEGKDTSPALEWSDVPEGARSLALVVDDPDEAKGTVTHWLVYDLPPTTGSLAKGVAAGDAPAGGKQGRNDFGRLGWSGPCASCGTHRLDRKSVV